MSCNQKDLSILNIRKKSYGSTKPCTDGVFSTNPTMTHWKAGLHVLRYLKSTRNYCITYRRSLTPTRVFGYADADYRSDPNDRISYTDVFMCNGGPISWNSHKQSTVAHSTMETKYMA